jgi:hypothetical protein
MGGNQNAHCHGTIGALTRVAKITYKSKYNNAFTSRTFSVFPFPCAPRHLPQRCHAPATTEAQRLRACSPSYHARRTGRSASSTWRQPLPASRSLPRASASPRAGGCRGRRRSACRTPPRRALAWCRPRAWLCPRPAPSRLQGRDVLRIASVAAIRALASSVVSRVMKVFSPVQPASW